MGSLKLAAATIAERASKIEGLSTVAPPQGAMYVLIQVDLNAFRDCSTDVRFAEKLLAEESVLVLPGNCFKAPGFIRIVTTVPVSVLQTAWDRIETFCSKRRIKSRKSLDFEARIMVPAHPVHFGLPRVASQVGGYVGCSVRKELPAPANSWLQNKILNRPSSFSIAFPQARRFTLASCAQTG